MCENGVCGNGEKNCCGGHGMHHHSFLKKVLMMLIIIIVVFWMGVQLGQMSGMIKVYNGGWSRGSMMGQYWAGQNKLAPAASTATGVVTPTPASN